MDYLCDCKCGIVHYRDEKLQRQTPEGMGIGKSNGLFHRPRPPTPCHPAATLPADARAWGRPARPAPAAGQRWMPPAGRRLAPQRTDRTGGWGRAACTAGAARGEAAGGEIFLDEFGLFGGELGVVHDDALPRWGLWERSRCRKSIAYSVSRAVGGAELGGADGTLPGVQPCLLSVQAASRAQGAYSVALACAVTGPRGSWSVYCRGLPGRHQRPVRCVIRRGRLTTARSRVSSTGWCTPPQCVDILSPIRTDKMSQERHPAEG